MGQRGRDPTAGGGQARARCITGRLGVACGVFCPRERALRLVILPASQFERRLRAKSEGLHRRRRDTTGRAKCRRPVAFTFAFVMPMIVGSTFGRAMLERLQGGHGGQEAAQVVGVMKVVVAARVSAEVGVVPVGG